MQSLLKNLAFAFSLALLLWLGYVVFFQDNGDAISSAEATAAAIESAQFIAKLDELKEIHLDVNSQVLSDPRFLSLIDQRQPVEPKPYGRKNPFLPLSNKDLK